MVPTKTVIKVIVGGVLAVGIGLVLYNNALHRPTLDDIVKTEPVQKLIKDEYNRQTDQELENYKHLPEYAKAHPEIFNYDNKTGLYSFKPHPTFNPNSNLVKNQTIERG